uniref:Uncharacterized protein n=1 Tax=Thermosporothrix sp. COM3 TaxID=2490863 RepID=A0A455SVM7_9CHLR|nr:hypothetical protein KTC_48760 [Thermosporothrix sp. COM3]BBH90190.1 hypothetical protein KTC_49410 [Thermosporothrix sp. COM3]BBH90255.1 hypothetical protein KTC_50060 [Thermosporothrix sp. COM3]
MNLGKSIFWLVDSLANPSLRQGNEKGGATNAISGLKFSGFLAKCTHAGLWEKTSRGYSQLTLDRFSVVSSPTWTRWGMMWRGQSMGLTRLEPPTDAIVSSLWPTPAASNPNDGEALESWKQRREAVRKKARNGNGFGMPLSIAVRWHNTAQVQDAQWLNPEWVECLMGFPPGWTDIKAQPNQESHNTSGNLPELQPNGIPTEQNG